MIDVRLIRTDYEGVRAALARRNKPDVLAALERAHDLDSRLRDITSERDGLRARVNALSKQVGELRRAGETATAEALQEESRTIGGTGSFTVYVGGDFQIAANQANGLYAANFDLTADYQ